jgi:hypothetical protein
MAGYQNCKVGETCGSRRRGDGFEHRSSRDMGPSGETRA